MCLLSRCPHSSCLPSLNPEFSLTLTSPIFPHKILLTHPTLNPALQTPNPKQLTVGEIMEGVRSRIKVLYPKP